jgi:hypothetical protein
MGFMDKANKLAEQAQSKIDEKLQQVNERLSGDSGDQGPTGPLVEYDQHGRPVQAAPTPPPAPPAEQPEEPERKDEYAPPKVTPGDPLAG